MSDPRQAAIDKAVAEREAGQAALPYMNLLHGTGKVPAKGKPAPSEGGDDLFDDLDDDNLPMGHPGAGGSAPDWNGGDFDDEEF